jgi:hypothetical protein
MRLEFGISPLSGDIIDNKEEAVAGNRSGVIAS